ncbi:MAG: sulfur carrier protein ThiS [Planctomycetota bacterium]|jgi:sulfur carrier protein|nr:sulfur carrier protein ThiS [Planctomycetota bacterium]
MAELTLEKPYLVINGETRDVSTPHWPLNPLELLEILGVEAGRVVMEINGAVVRRQNWSSHAIQPGDKIEVVNVVGGG